MVLWRHIVILNLILDTNIIILKQIIIFIFYHFKIKGFFYRYKEKKNEEKGKKETKKETLNKVRLVIFNSLEKRIRKLIAALCKRRKTWSINPFCWHNSINCFIKWFNFEQLSREHIKVFKSIYEASFLGSYASWLFNLQYLC